jgi:hypothetical protein
MIILSETTDSLQAICGEAHSTDPQCFASWRDRTSTTFVAGRTVINTNGTNAVTMVAAPVSSTQRVIDFLTIYNADNINATVTVRFNANSVLYILFKATLAAGETLVFQEGRGFFILANSGAIKHSINQGNNTIGTALSAVVLGADVINNNAVANTIQDVTGLSFAVTAGNTYYFKFIIPYTAAASTTGSRWTINGPVTPTLLSYMSEYTLTTTSSTRNAMIQVYGSPSASNATSVVAQNHALIEGIIKPSDNGTVIARFASEITSSAITAKAGAVCYYQQIL